MSKEGDQGGGQTSPVPASEPQKDEHGCEIGKERWDTELEKCVPVEAPAEKVAEEALRENTQLRIKIKELKAERDGLAKQLTKANDVLEAQVRAKLEKEIKERSHFTDVHLVNMSLDELQATRDTLTHAKYPKKSIRPGPMGPVGDENEGLTVGDLSIVTAERRKLMMEA